MKLDDKIFIENFEKGRHTPLVLKNDTERKEFLKTYKKWTIIEQINHLCLRIHEFKLKNDISILAFDVWDSKYPQVSYLIFSRRKDLVVHYSYLGNFRLSFDSENVIVKFLKDKKNEIE